MESEIEYFTSKHQPLVSEKQNGIETSHKQNIKHFNDSDEKLRNSVVSALNVDNQVLQEERENLLKKNQDLEGEPCFFRQEVRINCQALENSNSKVENLKTANLHLEREMNPIISKGVVEELNGFGRGTTEANPVDDGEQSLVNKSLGQKKENARNTDTNEQASSSYSQEQLKELMEKVDAATNTENEGPAGDTVPYTTRDEDAFGKFLSSITQCSLDENDLRYTLEAKNTEDFEVLRSDKSGEEFITNNNSKSSSCLISSSNAHLCLRAESPCSSCDMKVCEGAEGTKEIHSQRGLNSLPERDKIVRRLMPLLNCLSPVNRLDEENRCIVTETTCPRLILDQIEVQGKSVLCDNVQQFKAVFHLEEPPKQQVNEQGGMKAENKSSQSLSPSGTVAQSNREIENQKTNHMNKIYKELETLQCFLIEKKLATKELELLKKLRESIKELQEYLSESKPTTDSSLEFDDCKMNFKTSFDQVDRSGKNPSVEKFNAHNETVEELKTSLNQTKAEILTLEKANDKLNVEKTAALAAMDEIKKGFAKASEHVTELEKDLENANEERKRLGVAVKMVYDGLKVEQEEKKNLQAKMKVSQEENAHTKVLNVTS